MRLHPIYYLALFALGLGALAWASVDRSAPHSTPTSTKEWEPKMLALGTQTIKEEVVGTGDVHWQAHFDLAGTQQGLEVTLCIRLIPGVGTERGRLNHEAKEWEHGVEALLNKRFQIQTAGIAPIPLAFDLKFEGCVIPHYEVIVRPGRGRSDELHWNLEDPLTVISHEVGHMLGAFDEYPGGALEPEGQLISKGSIMANGESDETFKVRHLELLRSAIAKGLKEDVMLVPTSGAAQNAKGPKVDGAEP